MAKFTYLRFADNLTAQAVLTPLSEDSVYPVSNLKIEPIAKPWRTIEGQTAGQTLQIDFSSAKDADIVALVNHNLTVNAVITLNGGSSAAPDGGEFQTVISPTARTARRIFTAQSWRYWLLDIDDPLNGDGYIEIGMLVLGSKTALSRNFDWGFAESLETINQAIETEYGVIDVGQNITQRTRLTASWKTTTTAERNELTAFLAGLKREKEGLLFIPDPDAPESYYGRLVRDFTKIRDTPEVARFLEMEFTEDSPGRSLRIPLFIAEDVDEWDAGDSLTFFSRASVGFYKNNAQQLISAAADVSRVHFHEAGVSGLLVEPAATNAFTYSEQINDAAWQKTGATVTPDDAVAPDLTTSADKLVEDTSTGIHQLGLSLTGATDNTVQAVSFFAKADDRSFLDVALFDKAASLAGFFRVDLSDGSLLHQSGTYDAFVDPHVNGWYRVLIAYNVGSGGSSQQINLRLHNGVDQSYTGDGSSGIHIWGLQYEVDRPWPTSYVRSEGSPGVRAVETAWITATIKPQAVSIYVRTVELGQVYNSDGVAVALIGDAGGPHVRIEQAATDAVHHDNDSSTVEKTLSASRSIGDLVEYIGQISGSGAVKLRKRVNGGSPTESTFSANLTLPANWGAPGPLRLGVAVDSVAGPVLIQRVKVVRGVEDDFSVLE